MGELLRGRDYALFLGSSLRSQYVPVENKMTDPDDRAPQAPVGCCGGAGGPHALVWVHEEEATVLQLRHGFRRGFQHLCSFRQRTPESCGGSRGRSAPHTPQLVTSLQFWLLRSSPERTGSGRILTHLCPPISSPLGNSHQSPL